MADNKREQLLRKLRESAASGDKQLYLSYCQLTSLPPEVRNLTALTQLYLDNNELTSLPPEVGNLIALTELTLYNNHLTILPLGVGNLTALRVLGLGYNQLTLLPPEVGNLTALTELYLTNNQLTILPLGVGNLTALTRLTLNNNQITSLPLEVGNLTALTKLDLSYNRLTLLLPEVGTLTALTELGLGNNQLTSLPPEVGNLTALTWLSLSSNQLESIPGTLLALQKLETLDVNISPLSKKLPFFMSAQDRLAYLCDLSFGAVSVDSAQAVLLGEPMAGKTSLIRTLQSGAPAPTHVDERTITQEHGTLPLTLPSSTTPLHLHIVDLGGQLEYRSSHQLFLSSRSICLLVVDLSLYDGTDEAFSRHCQPWLEALDFRTSGDNQVVVVATHVPATGDAAQTNDKCDQLVASIRAQEERRVAHVQEQLAEVEKQLKAAASDIADAQLHHALEERRVALAYAKKHRPTLPERGSEVVCLDSVTFEGFTDAGRPSIASHPTLEAALIATCQQLDHLTVTVPRSYVLLCGALQRERQTRPFLRWSELVALIKSNQHLTAVHMDTMPGLLGRAVSFLHDSGDVCWYRGSADLVNYVFLDLTWLSNVLRGVVRHDWGQLTPEPEDLCFQDGVQGGYPDADSFRDAKQACARSGIMSLRLLRHQWHRLNVTQSEDFDALVRLLQLLGVAFPVHRDTDVGCSRQGGEQALAVLSHLEDEPEPGVLAAVWAEQPRQGDVVYTRQLRFATVQSDVLPAGFMERLQVQVLTSNLGFSERVFWKRGLAFSVGKVRVLLKVGRLGQQPTLDWQLRVPAADPGALHDADEVLNIRLLGLGDAASLRRRANSAVGKVLDEFFGSTASVSEWAGACAGCGKSFSVEDHLSRAKHHATYEVKCFGCELPQPLGTLVPLSAAQDAHLGHQIGQTPEIAAEGRRAAVDAPGKALRLHEHSVSRAIVCVPHDLEAGRPWYERAEHLWQSAFKDQIDVYVLCEAGAESAGMKAVCCPPRAYTIRPPKQWVVQHAGKLKVLSLVLRAAVAFAGLQPVARLIPEGEQVDRIHELVDQAIEGINSVSDFLEELQLTSSDGSHVSDGTKMCGEAYLALKELLTNPEHTTWHLDHAGLVMDTAGREGRWVCQNHQLMGQVRGFHARLQHSDLEVASSHSHQDASVARSVAKCQRCFKEFGLFRRRTLCGACPAVFCKPCFVSPEDGKPVKRVVGGQLVEVCQRCVRLGYFAEGDEAAGKACHGCQEAFGMFKRWHYTCGGCRFDFCSDCMATGAKGVVAGRRVDLCQGCSGKRK